MFNEQIYGMQLGGYSIRSTLPSTRDSLDAAQDSLAAMDLLRQQHEEWQQCVTTLLGRFDGLQASERLQASDQAGPMGTNPNPCPNATRRLNGGRSFWTFSCELASVWRRMCVQILVEDFFPLGPIIRWVLFTRSLD